MDESLRICLVSKGFPPAVGGAETYARELADGLAERGHDVDVYTQWHEDVAETVDVHENVTVYRITKARRRLVTFETLWFSLQVRRAVDLAQYDVVHGTLMPASMVAVTPFANLDVPVVLTSHGTSLGELGAVALETPADYLLKFLFHPMNVAMDWTAGRDADAIIAISEHAEHQLVERYGFDADRVHLIPHGVDTDRFYPREERHPAVDPEKTTLLYVGRLGARKGLDLALRALARVDDPDLEFLIAGTGRHEEYLRNLARELGIVNRVRFLGYVPDDELPVLYSSSDVFVLPSRYEGFGLVALEAMACGTPVIGADAGGISTAIRFDPVSAVVPRRCERFATALESVLADVRDGGGRFEAGNEPADDLSWDRVLETVEATYSALSATQAR